MLVFPAFSYPEPLLSLIANLFLTLHFLQSSITPNFASIQCLCALAYSSLIKALCSGVILRSFRRLLGIAYGGFGMSLALAGVLTAL